MIARLGQRPTPLSRPIRTDQQFVRGAGSVDIIGSRRHRSRRHDHGRLAWSSVGDDTYSSAGIQAGHSTDDFNYARGRMCSLRTRCGLGVSGGDGERAPTTPAVLSRRASTITTRATSPVQHPGDATCGRSMSPATSPRRLIRIAARRQPEALRWGQLSFSLSKPRREWHVVNEGGKPANFLSIMGLPSACPSITAWAAITSFNGTHLRAQCRPSIPWVTREISSAAWW